MCYYDEVKHVCGHRVERWRKTCEIRCYQYRKGQEMESCLKNFTAVKGGPRCPHCENARILGLRSGNPPTGYGDARIFGLKSRRGNWQDF